MKFLTGYKTYISAVLMIVLSGALAQGYIDAATYQILIGILASLGLIFLRNAIK